MSRTVSLIAAMGRNRVIGVEGRIPWRLPADFAFFRRATLGKPVIMGRKTWESLPNGALPGRDNIVLSRNPNFRADNGVVVNDVEAALQAAGEAGEIMVIGGAGVYRLFWDLADRIYLTEVDASFDGDAFFPEMDARDWREVSRQPHPADERNPLNFDIVVYQRRRQNA